MNSLSQKAEALLFTAGEAVQKSELSKILGENELDSILLEVRNHLEGSGLALVETNETAHITTSPEVAEFLASFEKEEPEKISKAAVETLAIIAYRGPLAKYEIDAIRGVDSRSMVNQLIRRGAVVRIRSAGTAVQYDVSDQTLRQLGIVRKQELPEFETLSNDEQLQQFLSSDQSK